MPPSLQPMVRPCVPTGRSALRTGVEACSGQHRCLHDKLGCRLQQEAASGSWTGPRLRWHVSCLELLAVFLALRRFLTQTLCKIREDEEQVLLVAPYWPTRTCPSLENSPEEGPSFSGDGHDLAPAPRPVEPPRVAPGRDVADLAGLPHAMVDTITQARAPSTRQAYALKWEGLERRLSPSTLKVYVAAIAAYYDAVEGRSLGKHHLVTRFLRGLRRAPFEPLDSVELKFLSLKTVLLTALASIKRVGDLQAFSVNEACLEFGPADSHVILRPRPGYVPKVPTTPFRDQVVNLQALPSEEADPALALLCPTAPGALDTPSSSLSALGDSRRGMLSKQRLAHWVVDAITLVYESQGEPCPLGVRAHSTLSVASSYALAHGASLADICRAAGWATPNTFARFYNLRIEPVSSRVLT
ncbi:putative WD repeat-containing protein C18B5.10c [Labeo rohita]|uniref:WD repeat-containing protein C18B5.10c n=1 Tax=Labeo rohita TaxID=84645 RepID=A0ABQ8LEM9_LABRO|nr:putative WD repeat-containing protein C18B5.10c [Labeo rohita]